MPWMTYPGGEINLERVPWTERMLELEYERPRVERVLALEPGQCMLDIGAHRGYYSLLAAKQVTETGRVIAVEMACNNLIPLQNAAYRNEYDHLEVWPCACAMVNGPLWAYEGAEEGQHSLYESVNATGYRKRVMGLTVDKLWAWAMKPQVHLLKVDVEGYEWFVLQGGLALLAACRPTLLIEIHPEYQVRANEVAGWLREKCDYTIADQSERYLIAEAER